MSQGVPVGACPRRRHQMGGGVSGYASADPPSRWPGTSLRETYWPFGEGKACRKAGRAMGAASLSGSPQGPARLSWPANWPSWWGERKEGRTVTVQFPPLLTRTRDFVEGIRPKITVRREGASLRDPARHLSTARRKGRRSTRTIASFLIIDEMNRRESAARTLGELLFRFSSIGGSRLGVALPYSGRENCRFRRTSPSSETMNTADRFDCLSSMRPARRRFRHVQFWPDPDVAPCMAEEP